MDGMTHFGYGSIFGSIRISSLTPLDQWEGSENRFVTRYAVDKTVQTCTRKPISGWKYTKPI
jgi:hypothetical protein